MAYDEQLAARVRELLAPRGDLGERRMFGGMAFMVAGHMACGIVGEELMLRLGPDGAERALGLPQIRPMDFTGRPMKGFVFADVAELDDAALAGLVEDAVDFVLSLPPK